MSQTNTGLWNPEQYEKFKNERSLPFLDLMSFIKPQSFNKVLDLGCGTGELTQLLHQTLKPMTTLGIDSSREMLKKSEEYMLSGLSFQQDNIETWRASDKYDLIVSNSAIQWCDHHEELFKKMYEGLNPGGQISIQMPVNHDYPTHVLAGQMSESAFWNERLGGKKFNKYESILSIEEYASLLFKLGFKEQKVMIKVYGHVLEKREDVVEWVKGSMLSYFRNHLTTDDYEEFLKEYQQKLFQILPDERPFFYPFKRIFFWAQR